MKITTPMLLHAKQNEVSCLSPTEWLRLCASISYMIVFGALFYKG